MKSSCFAVGIVRIPALLLSRVISDLREYVSYRRVDGRRTLYWYHAQFVRAAESRYVCDRAATVSTNEPLTSCLSARLERGTVSVCLQTFFAN